MESEYVYQKPIQIGTEGKRCYTVAEIQKILHCGKKTVYDLLKRNEFPYIKLGGGGYRISKPGFDAWLDGPK